MEYIKSGFAREDHRTPDDRRKALDFGKQGEQMAAQYLADKGYIILEQNYRRGHLEIDIIALDKDELVIVEVKTRAYDTLFAPEEAVNHKKRLSLIRLANIYVKTHNRDENIRFDIISIISNDKGTEIRHIENAYNVMSF